MRRGMYVAAVVLLAGMMCVLAVAMTAAQGKKAQAATAKQAQLEQTILDLQGQIRRVQAQEKSAAQKVGQLQDGIVRLTEKRSQDQQVIRDLWTLLAAGTRREKEANAGDNKLTPTAKDREKPARPDEKKDAKYDVDALKVAQDIANVGRTVSSSGRFLVHDRVGIALQQAGLTEQRQIYEALGDAAQIQELDARLQAIQERSATIDTMIQGFGAVMANMTEEDLASYVDGTTLNGEFATLQNIPEIAQALQQAQASPQIEAGQTTPRHK